MVEPGDHLVGHSYGGVVCLLAAARRQDALRSLTVIEPPATQVALDVPAVAEFAEGGARLVGRGSRGRPGGVPAHFLEAVGSSYDPPSPLPPELEQGARLLMNERGPWEAEIPLAALAATSFPKLVVSGAHHPAFDAICDRLGRELATERVVLPGFGHTVQRHPGFNPALADFVDRAAVAAAPPRR